MFVRQALSNRATLSAMFCFNRILGAMTYSTTEKEIVSYQGHRLRTKTRQERTK